MAGLWRNEKATPEGKYLVKRRDGSIPEWPSFVIGARDPAAPAALREYAAVSQRNGLDIAYVMDILSLADEFEEYRNAHGSGKPDSGHDTVDNPTIVEEMKHGRSA